MGYGLHGVMLVNEPLMDPIFEGQQSRPLAFKHPGNGNAGPFCHDLRDIFSIHLFFQHFPAFLDFTELRGRLFELLLQVHDDPIAQFCHSSQFSLSFILLGFQFGMLDLLLLPADGLDHFLFDLPMSPQRRPLLMKVGQFLLEIRQPRLRVAVFFPLDGLPFNFELLGPSFDAVEFLRHGVDFDPELRRGFIHEINGLVGKKSVGDVTIAQLSRRNNRPIGDADTMVYLVPFLESPENRNGVIDIGFVNEYRLEPSLECGIFFNVLPIFVNGRCTDRP